MSKKKRTAVTILLIIFCMIIFGCGGGGSNTSEAPVTPPTCITLSNPLSHCSEESIIGEYQLRSFGLEQISTGHIVYDETDFEPWSGTMIIDEWEMDRRISKTPDWRSEISQTGYLFYVDGKFTGVGTNGSYLLDGMFIILRWAGDYSIGSTNWGQCWKYEYWGKVSD